MVKFIATKRTSKSVTIDTYRAEKDKKKKSSSSSQAQTRPPTYVNIDRRHKYLRPTQKLKELDVNIAHYINEIKVLPYSYEIDQIGIMIILHVGIVLTL